MDAWHVRQGHRESLIPPFFDHFIYPMNEPHMRHIAARDALFRSTMNFAGRHFIG
jgi:hypothetical protein